MTTMQPTVKTALASLVEEHLTSLIREAECVKRHCKRARFHGTGGAGDFGSTDDERDGVLRRRLHADDINLALQWRGSEKLYATKLGIAADSKVDLDSYLQSEMRLRPPAEVGLTVHWLSVNGVQPEIPQNPSLSRRIVHRVEQDDDDDDEDDDGYNASKEDAAAAAAAGSSAAAHAGGGNGLEQQQSSDVHVHQLLPRLLSEELQLYFTKITLAVERFTNPVEQDAAIASVGRDLGLQELVPFLIRYITKELYRRIGNIEHCRTLIRLAQALLRNPHLHVELHLHQLLPALLTCIVAKRLSARASENHWALRQEAAQALVKACNLFGEDYVTLKARVLKTLGDAVGPDKPLETRFGGMVAISSFGPKAVDAFLLPSCIAYWQSWETALDQRSNRTSTSFKVEEQEALEMCQYALLNALRVYFQSFGAMDPSDYLDYEELVDKTFGDKLVLLLGDETDYAMSFI